jgi:hypothetical protein
VAAPDPVDIRLLSLVAETGKAAVHDIAARLGMDPRDVASRLVSLSAAGLPLIVGVECDQYGLRNAISGALANYPPPGYQQRGYPVPQQPQQPQYQAPPRPPAPPVQPAPPVPQQPPRPDPMSTWGPPQSSSWARGDQPTRPAWTTPPGGTPAAAAAPAPAAPVQAPTQQGRVGDTLLTDGSDGETVAIQLVEVVDPADFLFTAAGYRLREGERSVVVHTEMTNRGSTPFPQLPDLYLVLVAQDGETVGKAPVSLSSRPPHRIGVRPGETQGGHTVYVLPETTELTSIRWSFRPDDDHNTLTWTVEE